MKHRLAAYISTGIGEGELLHMGRVVMREKTKTIIKHVTNTETTIEEK